MQTKVDLLIKNAELVVPQNNHSAELKLEKLDLAIKDGKIFQIQSSLTFDSENIMDMTGLTILPGVIDSQVHFREPGLTHKETIASGTKSALAGGVTSVFEMPNTQPSTTTIESLIEKCLIAERSASCHIGFYAGAASDNLNKIHELENFPHSPGIKVFMGSSTGSLLVSDTNQLEALIKNSKKRIVVHAEDELRLKTRKNLITADTTVIFHPIWRDSQSAFLATQQIIELARKWNKKVHILHVTSTEEMNFLNENQDIATVEVLPQHLTLTAPSCYEKLGSLVQQNPPIRDLSHQQSLWRGIHNGTVKVLGSDHAPHTLEEKNKKYPLSPSGMPGVQTFIPLMLEHIYQGKISLLHWAQLVTENPRTIFNIQNKGRLQVGFDADLTVLDLKKHMTIDNSSQYTKVGWTPFDGMKVHGAPVMSFLNGQLCMLDQTVIRPYQGKLLNFR